MAFEFESQAIMEGMPLLSLGLSLPALGLSLLAFGWRSFFHSNGSVLVPARLARVVCSEIESQAGLSEKIFRGSMM